MIQIESFFENVSPEFSGGFFGSTIIDLANCTAGLEGAFERTVEAGLPINDPSQGLGVNEDVPYPPIDWSVVFGSSVDQNNRQLMEAIINFKDAVSGIVKSNS